MSTFRLPQSQPIRPLTSIEGGVLTVVFATERCRSRPGTRVAGPSWQRSRANEDRRLAGYAARGRRPRADELKLRL
jgi:hypothetical protein